jgi:cyclopropane-fatty-acyl-phospholipid synthase
MANRNLLAPLEALIYGPSYALIHWFMQSPEPLDAEKTWAALTHNPGGVVNWVAKNYPPSWARQLLLNHKIRQDVRLGIAEHYDVSNDFYELFLDRKFMFYTCADHINGDETLEEAQTKKSQHLLSLIDPHPGEKIIELGCGWGAMLKCIAEVTGDRENLYGYTLSKEQVVYNDEHNHFNMKFQNFITADYPENYYDKIYSIGAWEHVRPPEVLSLVPKLYRGLKPGGKFVQHFLCRLADPLPSSAVVSQLFFPGAVNSSYRFHRQSYENAGFRITHISVHDYRMTLRQWFERLVANRDRAIELVGIPTYNRYVCFFPSAWRYFNDVTGQLFRWVMEKK